MFYYNKGNQLNKCFTTTRVPKKTNVLLPKGYPNKQIFYFHKANQLNKCFTATMLPN